MLLNREIIKWAIDDVELNVKYHMFNGTFKRFVIHVVVGDKRGILFETTMGNIGLFEERYREFAHNKFTASQQTLMYSGDIIDINDKLLPEYEYLQDMMPFPHRPIFRGSALINLPDKVLDTTNMVFVACSGVQAIWDERTSSMICGAIAARTFWP